MANPNLQQSNSIFGNTAYIGPTTTAATAAWTYNGAISLTGLTPAAGTVNKINSMLVSNITGLATTVSIAIADNPVYASGAPFYIVYNIAVPSGATLIALDKTTPIYVTENQSIGVTIGTANAIDVIANFEVVT